MIYAKFEENLIIFVSEADVFIVIAPNQGWEKVNNFFVCFVGKILKSSKSSKRVSI